MRFLRMTVDKPDNITLSVYISDGKAYLSKSKGLRENRMLKSYENVTDALKAFDNTVMDDYYERGIYYDDFYGSD